MNTVMCRGLSLLSFVLLLAFVTPVQSEDAEAVRIDQGQVRVAVSSSPQKYTLTANIRTSFRLRNTSGEADGTRRIFPVAAPPIWKRAQGRKPWCLVAVNGKPVTAETKVLIDPESRSREWPNEERRIAWSDRINEWIEQDAKLRELVARYRKLAESRNEVNTVTREFEKRARRHLIHADELDFTTIYVATGDPHFGHLVRLMPEIDPKLRIDGPYKRWKYLSILNEYDPEIYRPYEKEWLEKVDQWFASKPELAELRPKLREVWRSLRESQKLLNGPILKHLHDSSGLNLTTSLQMQSFLERGGNTPSKALVRTLFTDIRKQLDTEDQSATKLLSKWGFDESSVSPFTGKLLRTRDVRTDLRELWRDQTVFAELGRPMPPPQPHQRNRRDVYVPVLVSFDAPLKAGESATVTLEHDVELLTLVHPLDSGVRFAGQQALASLFPSPGDVAVSVTCPTGVQLVIAPAPHSITVPKDGLRRFDVRLKGDATMLHLVPVGIDKDSHSWLGRFPNNDSRVEEDLRTLIEKTKNPTVRPLLMSALYSVLLEAGKPWDAHQLVLRMTREHPDFVSTLESIQNAIYGAKQAQSLYEWVLARGKSPWLQSDDDFNRFKKRSSNDSYVLTPKALSELARRVELLKDDELKLQERIGRRFILCQARIDTQSNLAELLKLAEANPKSAIESLKLVQFLTIEDKSAALPFVLAQIDLRLREKARASKVTTSGFQWRRQNAAYYALSTFRSPKAAPGIIRFIHVAGDSLLVQGATQALSHMTLPDRFDDLAGIADHVAASSESAFIQYLDLLLCSDPERDKALPLLDSLRRKYPKLAPQVMRALGRAGHEMQLPLALAAYENSNDTKGELQSAIGVIHDLAEPKDIAKLKYRRGLPQWMNERLVSIVRSQGGDASLFPFVEAYYLEHVRGKKSHNHLTCVAALEQIGDPRAIPHLREILATTERKRDAAIALGNLQLRRAIKRQRVDNPFDLPLRNAIALGVPAETRNAAWKVLLTSPDAAFRRAMQYGVLRSAIDNSHSAWSANDRDRVAFISRFGDVAARQLLAASEGCSLQKRYRIAELLGLVLPGSSAIIEADSKDESIDTDRRLTAQLALKLRRLGESTSDE